jgi:putative transposase
LFFVTTTCNSFIPLIEPKEVKDILIENLIFYNKKCDAEIVAYALMPEHIHLMIYFRNGNRLSEYMRDFKRFTTRKILEYWKARNSAMLKRIAHPGDQHYKVWMDRFDDVVLYSEKHSIIKLNYINDNPVKRGLCTDVVEYEYSSGAFYAGMEHKLLPLVHLRDLL